MSALRSKAVAVVLSFSLVLLQGAPLAAASRPAEATAGVALSANAGSHWHPTAAREQSTACMLLTSVLSKAADLATGVNLALKVVVNALSATQTAISITLEVNTAVQITDDTAVEMAQFAGDTAPLALPLPNFQSGLTNAQKVLQVFHRMLMPVKQAIADVVKYMNLQAEGPRVKAAYDELNPIQKGMNLLATALDAASKDTNVLCGYSFWASPDAFALDAGEGDRAEEPGVMAQAQTPAQAANCRAQAEALMTPVNTAVSGLNDDLTSMSGVLGPLQSVLQTEIGPALQPVTAIAASIDAFYKAATNMQAASKEFKRLLATMINVDVAGVTVASFSVDEILHGWDSIVNKLENELHIAEAKKWLQSELNRVLGGVINDLMAPVKTFEQSLSAQMNPATSAADHLDQQLALFKDVRSIQDQLTAYRDKLATLAKTCK